MGAKREITTWLVIAGVLLLVAVSVYLLTASHLQSSATIRAGSANFRAFVVQETESQKPSRRQARIGRMAADEAMLYVYPHEDVWQREFFRVDKPLDVVWLNDMKQVVYIVKNAALDETTTMRIMSTKRPARYVIEFPAGTVDQSHIQIDERIDLDVNTAGAL